MCVQMCVYTPAYTQIHTYTYINYTQRTRCLVHCCIQLSAGFMRLKETFLAKNHDGRGCVNIF